MSLLPSRDPAVPDGDPRVIGVDSDDADDVLGALSSETARNLLAALHDSPAPPGELADRVDTSLQNVQYHLEKLETAGTVEVVDTAYSEKGREMDVYAPADQPLVICAGGETETSGVRSALTSLLGGVGVLAAASLLVQQVVGGGVSRLLEPRVRQGSAEQGTPDPSFAVGNDTSGLRSGSDAGADVVSGTPQVVADGGADLVGATVEPGLAFFAGGLAVLACLFAVWYVRE